MNFKVFSDEQLVTDTKRAAAEERNATLAVLDRLREIQSRSLPHQLGFSSLHEFCVAELQYSDGAAHRRIHAMRLCTNLPKARQAIGEGTLSLSNATSLQNFFNKAENNLVSLKEKEKLMQKVQGKSKSECEAILNPGQKGKVIRFLADDETVELLKRLSEVTAIGEHQTALLIKRAVAVALRAIDPMRNHQKFSQRPKQSGLKKSVSKKPDPDNQASPEKLAPPAKRFSRYIPVEVERGVWSRDGGRCTYVAPDSKRRCSSNFGLQLDHILPIACGGPSTLENLRLLCAGHNRFAAIRVYGKVKMASFRRL